MYAGRDMRAECLEDQERGIADCYQQHDAQHGSMNASIGVTLSDYSCSLSKSRPCISICAQTIRKVIAVFAPV